MNAQVNDDLSKSNIYLVGLMGTGKSTIGQKLALRLEMTFLDSDREIQENTGLSISEIFAKEGEPNFRTMEKEFIEQGHPRRNCVVACGGGLCIPAGMMEALKSAGKVICLWANPDTLVDRTNMDNSRPLLQVSNPLKALQSLLAQREDRYREADIIIKTDELSPEEVVEQIVAKLLKRQD
ncbi:MAG TPA: shikimate kinase [Opitutae bacterium]|nr:shikimate kinase [Opitutae bacterium]|tara:strand:+ start:1190 stop:1732 length:543 start_codon:yes stop_codon:yes gene_type:complete